jgi:beta-glucosidase
MAGFSIGWCTHDAVVQAFEDEANPTNRGFLPVLGDGRELQLPTELLNTGTQNKMQFIKRFSSKSILSFPCRLDVIQISKTLCLAAALVLIPKGNADAADCPCESEGQGDPQLAYNDTPDAAGNQKVASASAESDAKSPAETPKYLDPKVPIEERIDDLLPRMTLQEKVVQLRDDWGSKGVPRLKIPALLKTEGLHGQSYSTGATIFPEPIEMASTFDTNLIWRVGQTTAIEAKAANLRASWSPVLDVARDARWGRVEETYGEDPWLVSRMGVAWITGFQGENMVAIPKHFAGHGEPLGGRDSTDVGLSDRTMRNIHLVSFRAAIEEAHAGGVMAAYSTWEGTPNNASSELLTKILREEWAFDGMVVSDCGGPENFLSKQTVVTNLEEACKRAILAGVDNECGEGFKKALISAVEHGVLRESDLEPNVRRVLRTKFKLGLFENPGSQSMVWDKLPEYDTREHRAVAREVAVEGSVLLKNDGKLLPLSKDIKTVAVIGPNADVAQTGDYSAKPAPAQLVTVLQAVHSHVSAGTKVLYAQGCDVLSADASGFSNAVEVAKQADAVILVVGDSCGGKGIKATSGENVDGATLEIPGVQRELIKQIQGTGKPVVLVLVNGKPFTLAWEAKNVPAILETWYSGEAGGDATADIIFGDRNPSGRLPITFPRNVGQLPLRYNYMPSGRNYDYYDMPFSPLYRFGYGLSYTTFKYSNLTTTMNKDSGVVTVSADVENTGDRDGDEVAQLYVTDVYTSVITPVIEMKGFSRVSLKAGEKKTVSFDLTPYQLSLLNADMVRVVEPGKFRVHVGGASPEPPSGSNEHKTKIGFKDAAKGVSGEFEMAQKYAADFVYDLKAPDEAHSGESFPVTVTVKNQGNLLDVAEVKVYGAGMESHRHEIGPGETKTYSFNVTFSQSGSQNLVAVLGEKAMTREVKVSASAH